MIGRGWDVTWPRLYPVSRMYARTTTHVTAHELKGDRRQPFFTDSGPPRLLLGIQLQIDDGQPSRELVNLTVSYDMGI